MNTVNTYTFTHMYMYMCRHTYMYIILFTHVYTVTCTWMYTCALIKLIMLGGIPSPVWLVECETRFTHVRSIPCAKVCIRC